MDTVRPDSGSLPRRQFLKEAAGGFVVLTVLVSGCSSDDDGGGGGGECDDGLQRGSTSNDGHSHTMCIPRADLNAPPAAGATYDTSIADAHAHLVTLTRADLTSIAGGGQVTVTSSDSGGHTHNFTLFM